MSSMSSSGSRGRLRGLLSSERLLAGFFGKSILVSPKRSNSPLELLSKNMGVKKLVKLGNFLFAKKLVGFVLSKLVGDEKVSYFLEGGGKS